MLDGCFDVVPGHGCVVAALTVVVLTLVIVEVKEVDDVHLLAAVECSVSVFTLSSVYFYSAPPRGVGGASSEFIVGVLTCFVVSW